jgi:hypothetical protein
LNKASALLIHFVRFIRGAHIHKFTKDSVNIGTILLLSHGLIVVLNIRTTLVRFSHVRAAKFLIPLINRFSLPLGLNYFDWCILN